MKAPPPAKPKSAAKTPARTRAKPPPAPEAARAPRVLTIHSGGRFEQIGAYSRAKRVGPFVFIAGTTAIEPSGELHAPDDAYAQSIYTLKRIEAALKQAGAEMRHVVRTRAFLANIATGVEGFVRAHGEVFRGIDPVSSAVQAGLTRPGMMVEIEVDAIIDDDATFAALSPSR
jgi:enamine deaminase RidA (YjgF/YER057c/UK114 family)